MPPTGLIRVLCLAAALPLAAVRPDLAQAAEPPDPKEQRRDAARLTMKERLSGKVSDPQRVNDCKVPIDQRDGRRPADCAGR